MNMLVRLKTKTLILLVIVGTILYYRSNTTNFRAMLPKQQKKWLSQVYPEEGKVSLSSHNHQTKSLNIDREQSKDQTNAEKAHLTGNTDDEYHPDVDLDDIQFDNFIERNSTKLVNIKIIESNTKRLEEDNVKPENDGVSKSFQNATDVVIVSNIGKIILGNNNNTNASYIKYTKNKNTHNISGDIPAYEEYMKKQNQQILTPREVEYEMYSSKEDISRILNKENIDEDDKQYFFDLLSKNKHGEETTNKYAHKEIKSNQTKMTLLRKFLTANTSTSTNDPNFIQFKETTKDSTVTLNDDFDVVQITKKSVNQDKNSLNDNGDKSKEYLKQNVDQEHESKGDFSASGEFGERELSTEVSSGSHLTDDDVEEVNGYTKAINRSNRLRLETFKQHAVKIAEKQLTNEHQSSALQQIGGNVLYTADQKRLGQTAFKNINIGENQDQYYQADLHDPSALKSLGQTEDVNENRHDFQIPLNEDMKTNLKSNFRNSDPYYRSTTIYEKDGIIKKHQAFNSQTKEESTPSYNGSFQTESESNCTNTIHSPDYYIDKLPHHCLYFTEYFEICKKAKQYYPDQKVKSLLKCRSTEYPPLCRFEFVKNYIHWSTILRCNVSLCNPKTLTLGVFDSITGMIDYRPAIDEKDLKRMIKEESLTVHQKFAPFFFLSCTRKNKKKIKIRQLLTLPPHQTNEKDSNKPNGNVEDSNENLDTKKFNINIVTIDSLSRQHFYRILPKAVETMKQINRNRDGSSSEILDFKGMQSLAPFTYVNVNALFNGTIDMQSYSTKNRQYTIQSLFTQFKTAGYQTVLQEEACWYDRWGMLLTGNKKLSKPINKTELWSRVMNFSMNSATDSFGLTHMTCEALRKYQMNSIYETVKLLCLNGKPLTSYFLDHLIKKTNHQDMKSDSKPLFTYTHVNFAHEKTETRIRAIDSTLASFIKFFASRSNSVTILWSDHGGKQSKYSMDTLTGRYEVYDPFLFLIVPRNLSKILPRKTYETLKENQNSLINILDVRNTLLEIRNIDLHQSGNIVLPKAQHSLFSTSLQVRRSCHVMGLRKYAMCKCLSNTTFIDANDSRYKSFILWLAEHSIGYLNEKLTIQQAQKSSHDNPRCIRLQGSKIRFVIEEQTELGSIYTFDILMEKSHRAQEIFNIQLFYNSHRIVNKDIISIQYWNRVSTYQKYYRCKDNNVQIDLCICSRRNRALFGSQDALSDYKQFSVKSELYPMQLNQKQHQESQQQHQNSTCLYLLKRLHNTIVTFEIANLCEDRTFSVSFRMDIHSSWEVNVKLPIETVVKPFQIRFMATFLMTFDMGERLLPIVDAQEI